METQFGKFIYSCRCLILAVLFCSIHAANGSTCPRDFQALLAPLKANQYDEVPNYQLIQLVRQNPKLNKVDEYWNEAFTLEELLVLFDENDGVLYMRAQADEMGISSFFRPLNAWEVPTIYLAGPGAIESGILRHELQHFKDWLFIKENLIARGMSEEDAHWALTGHASNDVELADTPCLLGLNAANVCHWTETNATRSERHWASHAFYPETEALLMLILKNSSTFITELNNPQSPLHSKVQLFFKSLVEKRIAYIVEHSTNENAPRAFRLLRALSILDEEFVGLSKLDSLFPSWVLEKFITRGYDKEFAALKNVFEYGGLFPFEQPYSAAKFRKMRLKIKIKEIEAELATITRAQALRELLAREASTAPIDLNDARDIIEAYPGFRP